jgi:DNA-binding MarR family transcriptional regulator
MDEEMAGVDQVESIGYWLFYAQRCVSYAFYELLKSACQQRDKAYIITPPQWGVLVLLLSEDGITSGVIAQKRGVDAPTITGIIKRLEQNGLLERRHDLHDRRIVKVFLTTEGREITASLLADVKTFNDTVLHDFSQQEQDDLLVKLQRIIANVGTVAEGVGDRFHLLPEHIHFVHDETYHQ